MSTLKKIIYIIIINIVLLLLYLFFDYINIMGLLSLNINRINIDIFAIILNNIIIIMLFLITYFIVDSKNINDRKNKIEIVEYMLKDDYETSLRYLRILGSKCQRNIIVSKCKTNDLFEKNEYFQNIINVSFKNYDIILQYANQGIITVSILNRYLHIRGEYSNIISSYIVADDMPAEVEKKLNEIYQNLFNEITKELKKINKKN